MPRALPTLRAACLAAAFSLAASSAQAAPIALAILIDTSGSVDSSEFAIQRSAYASFFADHAAAFAGREVAVTVMYWAGEGVQQQVLPWTTLDSASAAQAFSSALLGSARPSLSAPNAAQTGVARALGAATALFAQQSFAGWDLVIDISGDGTENLDFDVNVGHALDSVMLDIPGVGSVPFDVQDPWQAVFDARQAVLAAGILINALPIIPVPLLGDPNFGVETQDSSPATDFFPPPGITVGGNPVDVSAQWAAALVGLGYDQLTLLELFYGRVIGSPDSRTPLLVVANGFSAQELGDKISLKLAQELSVPEPSLGVLLLLALGAPALARRSRSAR